MLAPASVALALRIPLAHIEGGEISEGAIDDAVRNALTKLSHVHFTSTELARARVIAMGEEEWRVHRTGAASLDHLRRSPLLSREHLGVAPRHRPRQPTTLIPLPPHNHRSGHHPRSRSPVFSADQVNAGTALFCYPNADAGSRALVERLKLFMRDREDAGVFVNLDPISYWSLLQYVDLLVGNSSSGIIEAASFGLPVVDIGIRQQGRERGRNVLQAEPSAASILDRVARHEAKDSGVRSKVWRTLTGMAGRRGESSRCSLPLR